LRLLRGIEEAGFYRKAADHPGRPSASGLESVFYRFRAAQGLRTRRERGGHLPSEDDGHARIAQRTGGTERLPQHAGSSWSPDRNSRCVAPPDEFLADHQILRITILGLTIDLEGSRPRGETRRAMSSVVGNGIRLSRLRRRDKENRRAARLVSRRRPIPYRQNKNAFQCPAQPGGISLVAR